MASTEFTFREFTVKQDRCAMKVGTDGVLLGAWASGGSRILDIGTGTGLIALMMAQRFPESTVSAVEIDHEAATQARENTAGSTFGDRIDIIETAIQDFRTDSRGGYDAIVSNPPFFINALKNPDERRATARHGDSLTYKELFGAVDRLLDDDGVFSAIIPYDCLQAFVAEACLHGLRLVRQTAVRTTPRRQPRRYLLAFAKKRGTSEMSHDEQCLMSTDGSRSEWYSGITADFYIK